MGLLVDGIWQQNDVRVGNKSASGEFLRQPVTFRQPIRAGTPFPPAADRYHLYVSFACPWAHRTLIMRALKGLENVISCDVVSANMMDEGWSFLQDYDSIPQDSLFGVSHLKDIYLKADPKFTGRVTVPVLWDRETQTIVNNESSEIMRFFNSAFNEFAANGDDYYPESLRDQIDHWNQLIYDNINNGVYRCGFARSQEAYEKAFKGLFATLDKVEEQLTTTPYLTGSSLTEADLRLFPTILRFDAVYHTHFKCNGRLIAQYPSITRLLEEIRNMPGVEQTIHMDHIKQHYYYSHETINPSRIVALGPL